MKKGDSNMWWILVTAIMAIVMIIIIIMWFQSTGGKGLNEIDEKLELTKDSDKDGVPDIYDACPNNPEIGKILPEGKTC
jgi:H+/Cl- antiporter ClcA